MVSRSLRTTTRRVAVLASLGSAVGVAIVGLVAFFLLQEGLDRAEKWISLGVGLFTVVSGLGAVGLLGAWIRGRPQGQPDTSPERPAVDDLLLHARDGHP